MSIALFTSCNNSVNEEYAENNNAEEIANQQKVIYEYYVEKDSLAIQNIHQTKGNITPDQPYECPCDIGPNIYNVDKTINLGETETITFGAGTKVTYQGVGGGLSFSIVNGVGTVRFLKTGVYTNFQYTVWYKKCDDYNYIVYCPATTVKYKFTVVIAEK
ncbi:MAG: hypothetical protein ACK5LY_07435 [Lachnospirales bacterium]